MVDGRCGLRFTLKTGQNLGIFGYFVRQEFQGYEPVELDVLGLVDHSHPSTAELLDDAVVRDGLANHVLNVLTAAVPPCVPVQQSVGRNAVDRVRSQSSNPQAANRAPDRLC